VSSSRARTRSRAVDAAVDTLRRERPVASGILAGALAFRVFALLIPLAYVLVAGLGFSVRSDAQQAGIGHGDHLGDLVVDSIAAAAETSQRGRWVALAVPRAGRRHGGPLRGHRARRADARRSPGSRVGARDDPGHRGGAGRAAGRALAGAVHGAAKAPGALDRTGPGGAAVRGRVPGVQLVGQPVLRTLGGPRLDGLRVARVALVLLASLFLVGRLAVTAAELNATLWERRAQRRRPNAPPP
jgi:hypothetical protein